MHEGHILGEAKKTANPTLPAGMCGRITIPKANGDLVYYTLDGAMGVEPGMVSLAKAFLKSDIGSVEECRHIKICGLPHIVEIVNVPDWLMGRK